MTDVIAGFLSEWKPHKGGV